MKKVDWYWEKGLFDAEIKEIAFRSIPYDFTEKNPIRNCLTIYLDARNAMYDTTIKELQFYNCKLKRGDVSLRGWWKNDEVTTENDRYILTIDVLAGKYDSTIQFSFERCHVLR